MEWDIRNDQPIYTQLIQQVTLAILSGTFPCGGRLPPVREMAAEAGVNPNTMQRALAELERTGLVYTQRTAGRFVTEDAAVIDSSNRSWLISRSGPFCAVWSAWATTGSRPPSWCGLGRRKHKRWLF